jgi:hypothetical protein
MRGAPQMSLPALALLGVAMGAIVSGPAGASQRVGHWDGPQTRLDAMLDRASSNLMIVHTLACANGQAGRTEASLAARFDRVAAQARQLLGRDIRLTAINGGCAPFDRSRFTGSMAQFDHYLERAARMIRRRETN